MLGESHSLTIEFPEFKTLIAQLIENNQAFSVEANKYHQLDSEIRQLELDGAPINDSEMHQMKHQRSLLKDDLYQRLLKSNC